MLTLISFRDSSKNKLRITYEARGLITSINLTIIGDLGHLTTTKFSYDSITQQSRLYTYEVKSNIGAEKVELLVNLTNELNLKEIQNYQAPTHRNGLDGDLATTLTIESKGQVFQTTHYDFGTPINEIAALDNLLKTIIDDLKRIPCTDNR